MKQINWAILGLGSIASDFADALDAMGNNAYAAGSRSYDKALHFASRHNIPHAFGSYTEMLRAPEIDAVYIATPHCSHAEWILQALDHGKHVLCEKAITVGSEELNRCIDLANAKQLVLAEAMTIYHMPLYQELRRRIAQGAIGKLRMIQVAFGSLKPDDPTNRYFNPDLAGGALLDIGVYALSFARFFLSEKPNRVLTCMEPYTTGVDDASGILLQNTKGEIASITLTMRAKVPKRGIVAGDAGYICVDDYPRAQSAVIINGTTGKTETVQAGCTQQALQYEAQDFEACIRAGTASPTLALTRDVMDIMTQARAQWGLKYPFESPAKQQNLTT